MFYESGRNLKYDAEVIKLYIYPVMVTERRDTNFFSFRAKWDIFFFGTDIRCGSHKSLNREVQ